MLSYLFLSTKKKVSQKELKTVSFYISVFFAPFLFPRKEREFSLLTFFFAPQGVPVRRENEPWGVGGKDEKSTDFSVLFIIQCQANKLWQPTVVYQVNIQEKQQEFCKVQQAHSQRQIVFRFQFG